MNVEALRQLVRVLKKVPKQRFDLKTWTEQSPRNGKVECGTTACACGWAGADSWFNKQGFSLSKIGTPQLKIDDYTYGSWDAVKLLFGLTYTQSEWLFSSLCYPVTDRRSVAAVRERVEAVIGWAEKDGLRGMDLTLRMDETWRPLLS